MPNANHRSWGHSDPRWVDALPGGRYGRFGAGMLAVFTFVAHFLANRFWDMAGAARIVAINDFFEHIALVGGFVMAALAAELEQRRSMLEGNGEAVRTETLEPNNDPWEASATRLCGGDYASPGGRIGELPLEDHCHVGLARLP